MNTITIDNRYECVEVPRTQIKVNDIIVHTTYYGTENIDGSYSYSYIVKRRNKDTLSVIRCDDNGNYYNEEYMEKKRFDYSPTSTVKRLIRYIPQTKSS